MLKSLDFLTVLSFGSKCIQTCACNLFFPLLEMAIRGAFVVMTFTQLGNCLRQGHEHDEGLLESKSNVTVTGRTCCCYQPVGSRVYTDPFRGSCPVKPDRACYNHRKRPKPSACDVGRADMYDMYCEWYYVLACNSRLRSAERIMWNTDWETDYERM